MLQALTPLFALCAAMILRTDRRIVGLLERAGAMSAESATPFATNFGLMRWRLQRLVNRGAVVRAGDGLVYLDPAGWRAFRAWRRRRILTVLAIVLPAAVAFYFWSNTNAP